MAKNKRGGGRGAGRGGRGSWKKNREPRDTPREESKGYDKAVMENELMATYYKAQNLMPLEDFEKFLEYLRKELPTAWRMTGSRSYATSLRDAMIKLYFPSLKDLKIEDQEIELPAPLPWYPNDLGWQFHASRSSVRNNPDIAKFHAFLMSETEVGNVSRQEAVSMIPPLFLDVKPEHFVLDMCAAPGSKTAQLIEALHADEHHQPTGLVIANDSDYKRSHMLVKQTSRLQSPNVVITNHEAQNFPYIYYSKKVGSFGHRYDRFPHRLQAEKNVRVLQFDRILADVPCSGDGTLRKNKPIWQTWHQNNGNGLHKVQSAITARGCHFLRLGGRMVYSTCTFNPVENEAVVAATLNASGGALVLEDVSAILPGLKRNPGLTTWKVMDKDGQIHDSYGTLKGSSKAKIAPTCFPPENAASLGLEKCIRILPFHQNTGGFFVAVFKKVAPIGNLDKRAAAYEAGIIPDDIVDDVPPTLGEATAEDADIPRVDMTDEGLDEDDAMAEADDKEGSDGRKRKAADEEDAAGADERESKRQRTEVAEGAGADENGKGTPAREKKKKKDIDGWSGRGEEPFIFIPETHEDIKKFIEFYGLSPDFPSSQMLVRSEVVPFKTIYFVSNSVKELLKASNSSAMKINFPYRLSAESISVLTPYLSDRRVIDVPASDLLVMLDIEYPKFESFSEATQEKLKAVEQGCLLFRFTPDEASKAVGTILEPIVFPIWRAGVSASLLVPKAERFGLKARLTGERAMPHRKQKDAATPEKVAAEVEIAADEDGAADKAIA
ncbi:tRNA (cytosine(34)-C(5))-methyltransferase [Irineochytrium annulatum]|nr:tRNA (cytosine(34)-C(5))-methyltransferase [Irineochytrium annulatum]